MASANTPSTPTLAQQAASLYLSRKRRALMAVRAGQIAPRDADRALYPWLAIACLCGADLPELDSLLAEARSPTLIYGTPRARSDATARAMVAAEICPRERWAPLLAKTRDKAAAAATPPTVEALALHHIAIALAYDPSHRHHIPPYGVHADGHLPMQEAA